MRVFHVEVGGLVYEDVLASNERLAASRAVAIAAGCGRTKDLRKLSRGPNGLSVTIWDRGAVPPGTKSPDRRASDEAEATPREEAAGSSGVSG